MKQLKQLENLFKHIFQTRETLIDSLDLKKYSELEKNGIIKDNTDGKYKVDLYSKDIYDYLKKLITSKLNINLSNEISESFKTINKLEELIKNENKYGNIINAYSEIFNAFKVNYLVELDREGINIISYYNELKKQTNVIYELRNFNDLFFKFLVLKGIEIEQITEFLETNNDENSRYYLNNYLHLIVEKHEEFSIRLIQNIIDKYQEETSHYLVILITSMINKGKIEYLEKLKERLINNTKEILWAYSLLNLNSQLVYDELFEILLKDNDTEYLFHKTRIIESLMNSQFITSADSETLSNKLFEFFENSDDNEINSYFNTITYGFEKFEELKYELLHAYLNRTKNFKAISSYFYNFKEPKYLFHLIAVIYNSGWNRNYISIFEQPLSHFWSTSREKTEDFIISLISTKKKTGLLPIEIIMTGRENPMQIDLLKLKDEEDQVLAIAMICNYPHSFDKLLPILIRLKDSKFPKVFENLQMQLSILVCECYNEILIEWLENLIPKSGKKISFLRPIKQSLELYKEIKELKHKNNDLNPYYNEKSYIDFYYKLENENNAKMMESVRNNPSGLSSLFKNTSIIRGNSWKFEHEDNVMPLGKVETQMYIDTRVYKNPELYEYQLERFNK
ncbi:hypothetical protein [Flavobacterium pectinovorum]|uniref:Uncharacterized protein n=1 Tax=Flavobacterium pectinovorum TaxID=29533 RepID=A0AB36NYC2_9FLAO|nr:hypothetical protein [Flavobacterium pectinovorum]OXB03230.1 hypothetical protein B0A72_15840 [Flavobacterium pectinovorum]SHM43854.1 hypothetical protein SAMN05444387_2493 [Flavobacterium pectinovorum]